MILLVVVKGIEPTKALDARLATDINNAQVSAREVRNEVWVLRNGDVVKEGEGSEYY